MKDSIRSRIGLPPVAFAAHPTTGATIMIKRRRSGYYVLETRLTAEALNQAFGVTAEQAYAMLAGSMFGWDCPGANPATYALAPGCGQMNARRVH